MYNICCLFVGLRLFTDDVTIIFVSITISIVTIRGMGNLQNLYIYIRNYIHIHYSIIIYNLNILF